MMPKMDAREKHFVLHSYTSGTSIDGYKRNIYKDAMWVTIPVFTGPER